LVTLETLKLGKDPIVPYLGLFLRDITFADDGNPTYLENGQINFRKVELLASFFGHVKVCQQNSYNFKYEAEVQAFLQEGLETIDDKAMYKHSKFIEPPGLQGKAHHSTILQS